MKEEWLWDEVKEKTFLSLSLSSAKKDEDDGPSFAQP